MVTIRYISSLLVLLFVGVTLQWDPNTEPDLKGYKIYYDGDSGDPYSGIGALQGDSPIVLIISDDLDPNPNVFESLVTLPDGVRHHFAVTAYDDQGRESDYSNEVKLDLLCNKDHKRE